MTNRTCAVPGCVRAHYSLNYCLAHYKRYRAYGDPLKIKGDPLPSPIPSSRGSSQSVPCPVCGCRTSSTTDSRPTASGPTRRRRQCSECGERFTTIEVLTDSYLTTDDIQALIRSEEGVIANSSRVIERLRMVVDIKDGEPV